MGAVKECSERLGLRSLELRGVAVWLHGKQQSTEGPEDLMAGLAWAQAPYRSQDHKRSEIELSS